MVVLYSCTLFLSAFLLFALQPILGKLLLPLYGGAPAVWNTCMVFFQTMLLFGYFYANKLTLTRNFGVQAALHLLALGGASWFLFFHTEIGRELGSPSEQPAFHLIRILSEKVGIPFLLIASTSSLLQNWFGTVRSSKPRDPYHLYSASNLGSLAALLAYPFLLEPALTLSNQLLYWKWGYLLLLVLIAACACVRARQGGVETPALEKRSELTWRRRLSWFLLSFLPSSLLIGTTTYLSTDIAAVPLLWILPLVLYLASFVIAFSRTGAKIGQDRLFALGRVAAFLSCVAILGIILESNQPAFLFYPAHLLLFFLLALLCHLRLTEDRPPVDRLTDFYFWLSLGGVAGGMFNTLLAPNLFSMVAEYPLAILCATLFRQGKGKAALSWKSDLLFSVLLALLVIALARGVALAGFGAGRLVNLAVLGPPMILAYRAVNQPRRYAFGVIAIYAACLFFFSGRGHLLEYRERTFFGTNKVERDGNGRFRMFFHGSTLHGQQFLDPERRHVASAYFSRRGPMGRIFDLARKGIPGFSQVGVVGLGAGTLATYAEQGDAWTFYELDPSVLRIAYDSGFFTFLRDSKAPLRFVLGDARLRLREAGDGGFDLLILDAFSSDSIPSHLLTREAVDLYWSKLRSDGMLVFNVSSRYFDFRPLLAALARESGARAYYIDHDMSEDVSERTGAAPSSWIVMVRSGGVFTALGDDKAWTLLEDNETKAWTDDYSNILTLF